MKENHIKRNARIFKLRQQGVTYKQIALQCGISHYRASKIYEEIKDRKENFDKWPPLKKYTSQRIQNALINRFGENILNEPEKLANMSERELLKVKNLGKVSVKELLNILHALGYIEKNPISSS